MNDAISTETEPREHDISASPTGSKTARKSGFDGAFTAISIKRKDLADGKYGDKGCKGLYLWVRGNSRVWQAKCIHAGQTHVISLGPVATLSLKEAREKATELRLAIKRGEYAKPTKAAAPDVPAAPITFRQDVYSFWEHNRGRWDAAYVANWINAFENHVLPKLGDRETASLRVDDLVAVLGPLWGTRHKTAINLCGAINTVFARAMRLDEDECPRFTRPNPCLKLLDKLPRITPPEPVNHPSIPWREAPALYKRLTEFDSQGAKALRLLLLCCTPRTAEVLGAAWSEIEICPPLSNQPWKGIFHIPAARMKSGKARDIPLSAHAVALLDTLDTPRDGFMFTGKKYQLRDGVRRPRVGSINMDAMSVLLCKELRVPWHVHGMRATFKTWATDNKKDREAVEVALDHVVFKGVEGDYTRTTLLERRAELAEQWAAFLLRDG